MSEIEKTQILVSILGNPLRQGGEFLFYCPKCKDDKKKLSCNIKKNCFKCWICDYKGTNLKRLVRRFGDFSQKHRWDTLTGEVEINQSLVDILFPQKKEEEYRISLPKEFISLANKKLPFSSIEPMNYLQERGLEKEDIVRWKIGYCKEGEYKNRVVIPSFNRDGFCNYFVARSYTGEKPNYKNPAVSKDIVFNDLFVDWTNDLILVEGAFDAIKAGNAIPILGSSLREDSKLFQEIVKHDTPIYVALDPDVERKAMYLIRSLMSYDVELYKIDVTGYKDVGEMSTLEFSRRKKRATLMTQDTFITKAYNLVG
jgi:DNA primase